MKSTFPPASASASASASDSASSLTAPIAAPPAWQITAIKLAPLLVVGLAALGAYVLAGGIGALIAVLASLMSWVSVAFAARKLSAINALRRMYRTNRFMQDSIDAIPMPIFVKNRHGKLIMVNNAYCEQRHLQRADIVGKTASELTPDPVLAQLIADEDQSVLNGGHIRKEECIPHPVTGENMYQVVTKALSHSELDKPLIIGTFYDISSMRNAEQEARDALAAQTRLHEFLQFVLDALPTPLFVKDAQHRYIMTNRAHTEVVRMAASELLGKRASDIIEKEMSATLEAREDEMLLAEDGIVSESEHAVPNQHGEIRHEILRKVVGRDAEGKRVIIGTSTSITSLRQAEARWKFALEGAGDGLWDWDLVSGKVFYSPRWKTMQGFGEGDGEISDSETERTRRLHPEDKEGVQAALDVHLSGYVPIYICELRQRGKNGEYTWFMDRGKVVERSPEGKPLRMIGVYTDITHHKHAEDELRRHRDSLKEMIEEQTADLMAAKEAAERANAAKSLFLANMSHELRTPMHAVLSFARLGEEKAAKPQVLAEGAANNPAAKLGTYFQRIRESGDRLLHLLNDLLDLAKLEAGGMVLHIQRFDLGNTVQTTLREFEASLLARQLNTKVVVADGCNTQLMADPIRLDQVARNLLSNAIKFSPAGSCITLSFQAIAAEDGAGPMLELIVADEGIGIPADELETVFDKFIQSSKTRSNAGGTGLGLPICREIINAHQGQIFARNRTADGQETTNGTEFIVRIPKHPPPSSVPITGE